jgi:hypothetical protein
MQCAQAQHSQHTGQVGDPGAPPAYQSDHRIGDGSKQGKAVVIKLVCTPCARSFAAYAWMSARPSASDAGSNSIEIKTMTPRSPAARITAQRRKDSARVIHGGTLAVGSCFTAPNPVVATCASRFPVGELSACSAAMTARLEDRQAFALQPNVTAALPCSPVREWRRPPRANQAPGALP